MSKLGNKLSSPQSRSQVILHSILAREGLLRLVERGVSLSGANYGL